MIFEIYHNRVEENNSYSEKTIKNFIVISESIISF